MDSVVRNSLRQGAFAMIDPVSDMGLAHFHQITKVIDLPDFVKEGSVPTPEEVERLPHTSFADQIGKKFPVHTKEACYLSYAYFLRQKDSFTKRAASRIERKFNDMARFWDIEPSMDKLADDLKPKTEKKASTEEDYALTVQHNGTPLHYFPINNRKAVAKSAGELVANRGSFTYEMRKEAAQKLMGAYIREGFPISSVPDTIQSMAGYGLTTKEAAIREISRRVNFAKTTMEKKAAEPMKLMADQLKKSGEEILTAETLTKVAKVIDVYDRCMNVTVHYGNQFEYPEDVLFKFTKSAADKVKNELVTMQNGSSYWLQDLEKASEAFNSLGDMKSDFVDMTGRLDLHKVADIVPTLPRPDADLLEAAISECGVPKANTTKEAMVKMAVGCDCGVKEDAKRMDRVTKKTVDMHEYLGVDKDESKKRDKSAAVKIAAAKAALGYLKKEGTGCGSPAPRRGSGKFMKKAPNKNGINVLSKDNKDA
jgi:hypothetical protein